MSIALILELHNELRRIIIAGSEMAVGDFRLKRILPQMRKSGESVPVFAKVADATKFQLHQFNIIFHQIKFFKFRKLPCMP